MSTREEIETLLECDQDNGRPVISWGKLQWLCRLALAQENLIAQIPCSMLIDADAAAAWLDYEVARDPA